MAKQAKSVFFCGECGYESSKWLGKCPACGSWNTMVETKAVAPQPGGILLAGQRQAMPLRDVAPEDARRISTGIGELDRVLGASLGGSGVVRGSTVLLGGDPGIGKSTLLMQAAANLTQQGTVLYVTGEESAAQLKLRAQRLGVGGDMLLLAETDLERIQQEVERTQPACLIIDSIQTMYCPGCPSAAGTVSQVREATSLLTRLAKCTGCAVFIVGHVTKEGAIAGPRLLEHMVDTVLYFEGERHDACVLLRWGQNGPRAKHTLALMLSAAALLCWLLLGILSLWQVSSAAGAAVLSWKTLLFQLFNLMLLPSFWLPVVTLCIAARRRKTASPRQ